VGLPVTSGGEAGTELIHGFGYSLSQCPGRHPSRVTAMPDIHLAQASSVRPLSLGQSQPKEAATQAAAPKEEL